MFAHQTFIKFSPFMQIICILHNIITWKLREHLIFVVDNLPFLVSVSVVVCLSVSVFFFVSFFGFGFGFWFCFVFLFISLVVAAVLFCFVVFFYYYFITVASLAYKCVCVPACVWVCLFVCVFHILCWFALNRHTKAALNGRAVCASGCACVWACVCESVCVRVCKIAIVFEVSLCLKMYATHLWLMLY